MRIPRVFLDDSLSVGQIVELPPDRSHYVVNVLRLTAGREMVLFNGRGGEYAGTLISAHKKSATVEVGHFQPIDRESPLDLELAIGLSRGDRMDWIIQKATELGVSRISPLYTERTEVKLKSDRLEKKMEHWRQIVISACEQCQRNRLPELNPPLDFGAYLGVCDAEAKLVLHPGPKRFQLESAAPGRASIVVGPEGGFSEDELRMAESQGFRAWPLGERILRTETAPLAAISILQYRWGDLA